jgi:putative PEP-CTERM system TPR-repeat lipoprotein
VLAAIVGAGAFWLVGGPSEADMLASAKARFEANDPRAAVVELKSLLVAYPQSAQGRFLLGQALMRSGDPAAAEAELRRALDAGHPQDQVLPVLAAALMAQGKGSELSQSFGTVDLRDPAAACELKTQVATAHLEAGDLDAAEEAVTSALRSVPDDPQAQVVRARITAARGDSIAAGRMVDDLLARKPDVAEAWLLRGDLRVVQKGRDDQLAALEAYRKAASLQPDLVPAHAAALSILLAQRDLDGAKQQLASFEKALPGHPTAQYFQALLALQGGDVERGRQIAQQLLKGAPESPRLLVLAAQAELQSDSLALAEALLLKAVEAAPAAGPPRRMLAEVLLRRGQPSRALSAIEPLLAGNTSDADLLMLAGRAQLLSGNAAAAEASLARAAKLDPDNPRLRTMIALARLGHDPSEAALKDLEAIAKSDDDTSADLALISTRMRRREFDAALKAVDALAAKRPKSPVPDYLRGLIALQRSDTVAARKGFEAALAKEPGYLAAMNGLAALDIADGRPDAARARYLALVEREPGNSAALIALAELTKRTGGKGREVVALLDRAVKARPEDVSARIALIDETLDAGDLRSALAAAQAAVATHPNNFELLDRLGRTQVLVGSISQALITFNKMAAAQPKSALPFLRLADAYLADQKLTSAADAVRRAMAIDPRSVLAQRAGAIIAMRENRPTDALTIAKTMQKQYPAAAAGYFLEGEIELAQRQYDRAIAAYRQALTRPNSAEAAPRLHWALLGAKRSTEAERFAASWMHDHPGDVQFTFHLGDVASAENNPALAERHYREVLERQPENVPALNNVAMMLIRQGKPGAVAMAERALKQAPTNPSVLDTLAQSYAAENQVAKGIEVQVRAVALAPQAAGLRLNLAKLYLKTGDKGRARDELDVLAKLGSAYPAQAEVEQLRKRTSE